MNNPVDFLAGKVGRKDPKDARRAQIAELARNGSISLDSNVPMGYTLDYISGHIAWDAAERWVQHGQSLYEHFASTNLQNPRTALIDREQFDRHLKRWLTAHTLLFEVDKATNLVTFVRGVRFTSRPRTREERAGIVEQYKSFDR